MGKNLPTLPVEIPSNPKLKHIRVSVDLGTNVPADKCEPFPYLLVVSMFKAVDLENEPTDFIFI
jgi:hypothetical protein